MWWYERAGRIERFENKTSVGFRLEPVGVAENAPHNLLGLARLAGARRRDAFGKRHYAADIAFTHVRISPL